MSAAQLAEVLEFDDGDDGGGAVDRPGLVLLRFCQLVQRRGGTFQVVVMEMLERAIADVAKGSE